MYRFLIKDLETWKNNPKSKPLILEGARQVGKTYLLQKFGENYFKNYHYLNFEKNEKLKLAFEDSLEPKKILEKLKLNFSMNIDEKKDLIIFDEIQECPRALTSLKYFYESKEKTFICSAGSLLGVKLIDSAFPVGKIEFLPIFPMSFVEFLLANKRTDLAEKINQFQLSTQTSISKIDHEQLFDYLKLFLITGGLPEVVSEFVKHRNDLTQAFTAIRSLQENLLKSYIVDFTKHSGKVNAMHLESIWRKSAQLLGSSENGNAIKFKFKGLIPGIKSYAQLEPVFNWLVKAGLVLKSEFVKQPTLPLKVYAEANKFKLYNFDVGILGALADLNPAIIYGYDFGTYKGFFAENFVAQELSLAEKRTDRLFTWQGRNSEIEFIKDVGDRIVPIEVKSGQQTKSKSLYAYSEKHQPKIKVIISAQSFRYLEKPKLIKIPLYLSSRINQLLSDIEPGCALG